MEVSVIIVNYNTKNITKNCIDSVFSNTRNVSFEIILVDNSSTDGSKEYFQKDKRIRYIYNNENVGFGRANNIGYKVAKGKYIFLLNSDTILLNNAISIFLEKMRKMPSTVACLGTILLDLDRKPVHSYGSFLDWSIILPIKRREIREEAISEEGLEVDCVLGADLFIKRSVIEEYGLFDPIFFMYQEENDLQRRYYLNGFSSRIITGPKIIHLEGKSNSKKINTRAIEGTFVYMKKWMTKPSYYSFRICYAISRIPFVFFYKLSINESINYIKILFK